VLILSFVALAVLWPRPKLAGYRFIALPLNVSRVLLSRPVAVVCGAIGAFLLALTIYAGLTGVQTSSANFAPTFVCVIFWFGLVPLSVLFGDVFRAFNPWRAIGGAGAWVARTAARTPMPAPLSYPERLGHWPSAAVLSQYWMLVVMVGFTIFALVLLLQSNA